MLNQDKRRIAGEPEDYDDFANSWFDDFEPPIDEAVSENPSRGEGILPLTDSMRFAREIADAAKDRSLSDAERIVLWWQRLFDRRKPNHHGPTTAYGAAEKLLQAIRGMADKERIVPFRKGKAVRYVFPIFKCGNMKLPFWTWSKLPDVTCPGAGECRNYCYSKKHMTQPGPAFMWAQNTLMAHNRKDLLAKAFRLLPEPCVLRLHVDGDFETAGEIAFWMRLLASRAPVYKDKRLLAEGVSSYAYTKSWEQALEYDAESGGAWPKGFFINISSGGKHAVGSPVYHAMMKLQCMRGEFMVFDDERIPHFGMSGKSNDEKDALAEIRRGALADVMREKYQGKRRWFPCVGKCALCVHRGNGVYSHACGAFDYAPNQYDDKGVVIGIWKH